PEEQRQNANMPSLGLHVLTKTKLRLEWLQGQVICSPGVRSCGETPDLSLFLGEIGFCFVELRPVGSWTADFGELGVKRLRVACIAGGLRGASGAQKAIEAVWRILQDGFVFGEGIGGTLEFEEHVREHFARRLRRRCVRRRSRAPNKWCPTNLCESPEPAMQPLPSSGAIPTQFAR